MIVDTKAELAKYLKKVCKDPIMRKCTLEFYDDLIMQYDGKLFTSDDFEKMTINGVEMEQDIVKDLFSEKDSATIDEIFLYNFKRNIKEVSWMTKKDYMRNNPGTAGLVNTPEKRLALAQLHIVPWEEPKFCLPLKPLDMSGKEYSKLVQKKLSDFKKDLKKQKKDDIKKAYKHTMYHELGHVLEKKTFNDGQFVKTGITRSIIAIDEKDKECYLVQGEVTEESIENIKNKEKSKQKAKRAMKRQKKETQGLSIEDIINALSFDGEIALSEIWNEIFASKVDKTLEIVYEKYGFCVTDKACSKTKMIGKCGYNKDYDIAKLVEFLMDDDKIMMGQFNSTNVTEKIENLKISQETLDNIKKSFIDFFAYRPGDNSEVETVANKLDKYEALTSLIGIYNSGDMLENGKNDDKTIKYKGQVQDILVEGIANDIRAKLEDPNVVKDKKFFEKIDNVMKTIDNVILYPEDAFNVFRTRDGECLMIPVSQYALCNPESKRFSLLEELRVETMNAVKETGLKDIEEFMPYAVNEEKLNEDYVNYIAEREAKKLKDEKKKEGMYDWGYSNTPEMTEDQKETQKEEIYNL